MSTQTYREKLKDPRWQMKRLRVMETSGNPPQCQRCGSTRQELHIHHRKYVHGREPWEYEVSELECLCSDCHARAHGKTPQLQYEAWFQSRKNAAPTYPCSPIIRDTLSLLIARPELKITAQRMVKPEWLASLDGSDLLMKFWSQEAVFSGLEMTLLDALRLTPSPLPDNIKEGGYLEFLEELVDGMENRWLLTKRTALQKRIKEKHWKTDEELKSIMIELSSIMELLKTRAPFGA